MSNKPPSLNIVKHVLRLLQPSRVE